MKIVIPGQPMSKERARHLCTRDRRPYIFDPQKKDMVPIAEMIGKQYREAIESEKYEIAIEASEIASSSNFQVTLVFIFTPSKSLPAGYRNALLWGFENNNHKPDLDNMEKLYLDCATMAKIWADDAQVISLNSKKIYAENARTEMTIVAKKDFTMQKVHMKVLCLFSPAELNQFMADARYLSTRDKLDNTHLEETTYCAAALISFSNKYADKLVKVKKIASKGDDNDDAA